MRTTEFRKTANRTYLQVTYGLQVIGSQEPYFSITASEHSRPIATDRTTLSCGMLHDLISATFPELAPLIAWHLSSASGPMHYTANAEFWKGAFHGIGRHCKPSDREIAPSALATTIVLGSLPNDPTIETALAMDSEDFSHFIERRLPWVRVAFQLAMQAL